MKPDSMRDAKDARKECGVASGKTLDISTIYGASSVDSS